MQQSIRDHKSIRKIISLSYTCVAAVLTTSYVNVARASAYSEYPRVYDHARDFSAHTHISTHISHTMNTRPTSQDGAKVVDLHMMQIDASIKESVIEKVLAITESADLESIHHQIITLLAEHNLDPSVLHEVLRRLQKSGTKKENLAQVIRNILAQHHARTQEKQTKKLTKNTKRNKRHKRIVSAQ